MGTLQINDSGLKIFSIEDLQSAAEKSVQFSKIVKSGKLPTPFRLTLEQTSLKYHTSLLLYQSFIARLRARNTVQTNATRSASNRRLGRF